jgi:hypothetical protein
MALKGPPAYVGYVFARFPLPKGYLGTLNISPFFGPVKQFAEQGHGHENRAALRYNPPCRITGK